MREPTVTWRRRNLSKRLPKVLGIVAVMAALVGVFYIFAVGGAVPSAADVIGEPVRASTAAGDRVHLMTSQWRTFRSRTNRSGVAYTTLFVDVWGFDPDGVRPVWRTRIASDRRGVNMGRKLLGVQGGVLWLLDGKGLVGLSPKDGSRVAGSATFEAANPAIGSIYGYVLYSVE